MVNVLDLFDPGIEWYTIMRDCDDLHVFDFL